MGYHRYSITIFKANSKVVLKIFSNNKMFTRTRPISAVDRVVEAADFQVDVKQVSLFAVEPLNVEPADAEGAHEVGGAVIRIGEDADVFAFEDV
jgi:hypothetical protein